MLKYEKREGSKKSLSVGLFTLEISKEPAGIIE